MATSVRLNNGYLRLKDVAADWEFASSMDGAATAITGKSAANVLKHWNQLPHGPRLWSIQFIPGASGDELFIKSGSVNGPHICHFKQEEPGGDMDNKGRRPIEFIKYFYGKRTKPFIDVSECTLGGTEEIIFCFD